MLVHDYSAITMVSKKRFSSYFNINCQIKKMKKIKKANWGLGVIEIPRDPLTFTSNNSVPGAAEDKVLLLLLPRRKFGMKFQKRHRFVTTHHVSLFFQLIRSSIPFRARSCPFTAPPAITPTAFRFAQSPSWHAAFSFNGTTRRGANLLKADHATRTP